MPGTVTNYNNKAVNLLAGVIEKASGVRMDKFVIDELFVPLAIEQYQFYFDESGNPYAMEGLQLTASDAAKFGLLVARFGQWQDKRLISKSYIEDMLAQSQASDSRLGLLWWRHEYISQSGEPKLLYFADGYLGQYIVVVPELELVGVRQIKRQEDQVNVGNNLTEFRELMAQLAQVISSAEKSRQLELQYKKRHIQLGYLVLPISLPIL